MPANENGLWLDAQGNLVADKNVKEQDRLEEELVLKLVQSALAIHNTMSAFKSAALSEAGAFRELIADQYGAKKGGAKGNMTLRTYDGTAEVQVAVSDSLSFGPELWAAKSLIDECVARWSAGANDNIQTLINHAFQVNKQNQIDTHRVLGLRKLDIDDPEWKRAMEAISDAVRVSSSKTYIRFYQVNPETGARTPISLDLASV